MKSSAIANSNIALIKYWGRLPHSNPLLNIPANDIVSLTKYGYNEGIRLQTHTTIEFSDKYEKDRAILEEKVLTGRELQRIQSVVNPLRELARVKYNFKMESVNDFPTQAGLASSASAFAALAIATADALTLNLTKKEMSIYARLGSGSAARSVHGGFVYCYAVNSHEQAFAEQICRPDEFDMNVIVIIVDDKKKEITSDVGHNYAHTSLFNELRIKKSYSQAKEIKQAILNKDFTKVGAISEQNCLYMHTVMMTSNPSLFYWSPDTLRVMKAIHQFRKQGLECYFTIDAGPNVHCLCRKEDIFALKQKFQQIEGVKGTILAEPASDSYITSDHLF